MTTGTSCFFEEYVVVFHERNILGVIAHSPCNGSSPFYSIVWCNLVVDSTNTSKMHNNDIF